jgi:hypothetical protein
VGKDNAKVMDRGAQMRLRENVNRNGFLPNGHEEKSSCKFQSFELQCTPPNNLKMKKETNVDKDIEASSLRRCYGQSRSRSHCEV